MSVRWYFTVVLMGPIVACGADSTSTADAGGEDAVLRDVLIAGDAAEIDASQADSSVDTVTNDTPRFDAGPDLSVPPLGPLSTCSWPREGLAELGEVSCYRRVEYGPFGDRNLVEVYFPPSSVERTRALAVFIHGGGFIAGGLSGVVAELASYLPEGIAVAAITYRFSTTDPFTPGSGEFPAFYADSARALQFLRYYAEDLGVDPDQVALFGGSAGAGISQFLAFHDDLADPRSADPLARISTRVGCIGPIQAQTSYDPRLIKALLSEPRVPENTVYKEPALLGIYGLTPAEYEADEAGINKAHGANFAAASPIAYLGPEDRDVKVFMHYRLRFGVPNIHTPFFGTFISSGEPRLEGFEFPTFDELGMTYALHHPDAPPPRPTSMREFFQTHCFE